MNHQRRKILAEIRKHLDFAKLDLEQIAEEERDAFENMSEGLQVTSLGVKLEENASNLEEARILLENCIAHLEEVS